MMERRAPVEEERPAGPLAAWQWPIFAIGNMIQTASVVYELVVLDVCLTQARPDSMFAPTDEELEEQEQGILLVIRTALVLGLGYDLLSTLILSKVFESPLDAKHAYKIPPEQELGCCTRVIIRHITPLVWGVVCILVGVASVMLGEGREGGSRVTCDLSRSDDVKIALSVSGVALALVGGVLITVMAILLPCLGYCCEPATTCFNRMSRTFPEIDLTWQGFSIVWAYSSGSIGAVTASILAGLEVLASVLTIFGSSVLLATKVGLDNI